MDRKGKGKERKGKEGEEVIAPSRFVILWYHRRGVGTEGTLMENELNSRDAVI